MIEVLRASPPDFSEEAHDPEEFTLLPPPEFSEGGSR
ncbi:unnamed protein product, partial [Allacma fusca]